MRFGFQVGERLVENERDNSSEAQEHLPVLVREAVECLSPGAGATILDGTVGFAGHASVILERLGSNGLLIGLDRDAEALDRARVRLDAVGHPFFLFRGLFTQVSEAIVAAGKSPDGGLDGVLLDLGVSSYQLDTASRGFSFSRDGPLDMRMGVGEGVSAAEWVATASVGELEKVFREYGEEPAARRVALAIDLARAESPIDSTARLAEIVESVVSRGKRKIHPATRVFQAIRIQVNGELELLDSFLRQVDRYLVFGGRVVVLSYHSLEDRIVKNWLRSRVREGIFRTQKPELIRPSEEEIRANPRARSARLRWAIRGG